MTSIALIDCNNFYASCERIFRPDLAHSPIVILSNNDGCIVSRSDEAKHLNIPVGAPYFEWKKPLQELGTHVFSSNYSLYGDISHRIMKLLHQYGPIEVYSIDEAFIDMSHIPNWQQVEFAQEIQRTIAQYTGIPISIGIAATKTLAKAANEYAKQDMRKGAKKYHGVVVIGQSCSSEEVLKELPVAKVWGIGRQYEKKLQNRSIRSAYDFAYMSETWVKQEMKVVGLRTQQELKGIQCINIERIIEPRDTILASRSFNKAVTDITVLKEGVSSYVTRACEKLRRQGSVAHYISVFMRTGVHNPHKHYSSVGIPLENGSNYTPYLISAAHTLVEQSFVERVWYKKAGVWLAGITPESERRQSLFSPLNIEKDTKQKHAIQTLDSINNKIGSRAITFASSGVEQNWRMLCNMRSPRYTTSWEDIQKI